MKEDNLIKIERGADSIPYRAGKGLFIGLMLLSLTLLLAFLGLIWWVPTVGLSNIHPYLPTIVGSILLAFLLFLVVGALLVTVSILKGKEVLHSYRMRGLLIKLFLPLMTLVGGILRIPKEEIQKSFIEINNQLVLANRQRLKPERLLVLMPHCIQYLHCKIKVTLNIENCVMCGKCEIKDLNELAREFNVKIFVSSGGTMARRFVREKRPAAVVAVACERDLTSGIQDAYPLPVIGIVNKRPQGYCLSTGVDVEKVREAIVSLLDPDSLYRRT